jgi:hypothetical protein
MNPPRSRPDYRPPPKDDRLPWEIPTPTSIRNQKARKQAREEAQQERWIRPSGPVRTEPTEEEREEAQRMHDAGLVRSAAAQQLHRSGAARAVPRTPAWLPPKDRD